MDSYLIENSTLVFRNAVVEDCDSIVKMYNKIAITDENYKRLLEERLFEKRGGMFEISSVSDIEQRIKDEKEHIIIGELDKKTVSMLWYGLAGKDVFGSLKALEGCEKEAEEAMDLLNRNKIGCAKEIISLKSKASHIMPYILNLEVAQYFLNHGIEKMLCEVYCVDGYSDAGGYHETDLFNRASAKIVTSNGFVQPCIGKNSDIKRCCSNRRYQAEKGNCRLLYGIYHSTHFSLGLPEYNRNIK